MSDISCDLSGLTNTLSQDLTVELSPPLRSGCPCGWWFWLSQRWGNRLVSVQFRPPLGRKGASLSSWLFFFSVPGTCCHMRNFVQG